MKDQLKEEMKAAMKAKDSVRLGTIRSILSAIQYEEMQKNVDSLSDDAMTALLKNESKKRSEGIEFAEQAGRTEEVESLKSELEVIDAFLPQQLTEEELEKFIGDLKESGAADNMGLAMKALKDAHFGSYDGKIASQIAKRIFG